VNGIRLRPVPEEAGKCPHCDVPLRVRSLRLPGWRTLIDGQCPRCTHRFLQDVPNGHGLVYPTTCDLTTGETLDPTGASWFSSRLKPYWERPDGGRVELVVRGRATGSEVILANCLDPVYGHALLKLLGLQGTIERAGGLPVIALAPAALGHLIPDGVAETWLVRSPVARLGRWLLDLEEGLEGALGRLDRVWMTALPPHPHPSTFDLDNFVGHAPPETVGSPSVVLSLRPDRRWGVDAESEAGNVARLVAALRLAYPDVGIVAVGAAPPGGLPAEVLDVRDSNPGEADERRWIGLCRGANLAVGVHGSNLLLPSGLAGATIELIPLERYGNYLQASLVTQADPVLALDRHRPVFGDLALSDVSGDRVGEIAVNLLDGIPRVEALMTGAAAGVGHGELEPLLASPSRPARAEQPSVTSRAWRLALELPRRATVRLNSLRRRSPKPYAGPLPLVLSDDWGSRFELHTFEEVDAFRHHGGHFERSELDIVSRFAAPGMVAIDVGANIGAFTALLARRLGPGGQVHAFEPLERARTRLRTTLQLNGVSNVIVNHEAVADKVGHEALADYGAGFESWSTLAPREIDLPDRLLVASAQTRVGTTTLDDYSDERGIERIDILKIDVEGAEHRVLMGAKRLLERGAIDLLLIEVADTTLNAAGSSAIEVVDLLERSGLRTHVVGDDGRLVPLRVAGPQLRLVHLIAASAAARRHLGDG
jgi:FkbM family methyltransferase